MSLVTIMLNSTDRTSKDKCIRGKTSDSIKSKGKWEFLFETQRFFLGQDIYLTKVLSISYISFYSGFYTVLKIKLDA